MTTVFYWIGVAWCAASGATALLWAWEVTLRKVWKRMVDSADVYRIILEYAKTERVQRRKHKTIAGNEE